MYLALARRVRSCSAVGARTVRELAAWQLAESLRLKLIAATGTGPGARDRDFCDQIRNAAIDSVSDIAEGFARYRPRDFATFLGYALSSLGEVQMRIRDGHSRGYLDGETAAELLRLAARAEAAARALRRYLWSARPEGPRERRAPRPR